MARPVTDEIIIMDAASANGQGIQVPVQGYLYIGLQIVAGGTATGTIKVRASDEKGDDVDVTAALSATNHWDYVSLKNKNTGSIVAGDTGIAFAGAAVTVVERVEINDNAVRNIAVELSGYAAGTFTVKMMGVREDAF